MSDNDNSGEISALKASLRAVTEERNKLRQEVNTWRETGATWEARDKSLTEQVAKLQTDLKSTNTRHEQDMHLSSLGISSKRGRRAIRREYADALSELGEGAERPAFADFVGELKEDPLYGRWFSTGVDKSMEKSAAPVDKPKATRKPASNPNAGAGQPEAPAGALSVKGYNNLRAKHGRKAGRMALELLRKQGLSE